MELFVKRVAKFLLHTFNTIILIYGLFLIVCGIMIVQDIRSFSHFLEKKAQWLPYFVTFNGIMMVLLASLGFWATYKQNYKLLVTFSVSAVIVLLTEVAIITWVWAANPLYTDNLRSSLRRSFTNYTFIETDRKAWDKLQRKIRCCGIDGPLDWGQIYAKNQVPASCCIVAPDQPGVLCRNTPNSEIVHQLGCYQLLLKRISDHWSVVSLLAGLAASVQIIVLLLSVVMAFLVKREKIAKERQ